MKKKTILLIITLLLASCAVSNNLAPDCEEVITLSYKSSYSYPYKADFKDNLNHPFPRLAMWWPSSWYQDVSDLAKYNWIGWGFWEDMKVLNKLKKINPNQLHFMSGTITETSWSMWKDNDYKELMSKIPGEWFLTSVGSNLLESVDSSQQRIRLTSVTNSLGNQLFKVGDTITCEYETMKILEVNIGSNEIIVERGYIRSASPHNKGTRIAPHITFWPESWVMNLSDLCPKVEIDGEKYKWREWALENYLMKIYPNNLDGYILDRLEDSQSWLISSFTNSISPDYTNNEIKDYTDFDNSWLNGIRSSLSELKELINNKYIIANSFGAHYDLLDGCIYEGMPTNWSDNRPLTYLEWAIEGDPHMLNEKGYLNVSQSSYPNFSFVETYEVSQWYDNEKVKEIAKRDPNLRHMRFGLTSALLGNGYYSYETSTQGHGALRLYWFDEYDDGGKNPGYLGYPLDNYKELVNINDSGKVFSREYENGLVLCNPTNTCIEVFLEDNWRMPNGKETKNNGKQINSIHLKPRDGRVLIRLH